MLGTFQIVSRPLPNSCALSRNSLQTSTSAPSARTAAAPGLYSKRAGARLVRAHQAGRDETEEQALERRLRESAQVDERVELVESLNDLKTQLKAAKDKLVVLEIMSDTVCETGLEEEVELQWKLDQNAAKARKLEACNRIKHTFARTARECPDSLFLSVRVPEGEEEEYPLLEQLGVEMLPTIQFYKAGELLWEQRGSLGMEQGVGDGVLFYGNGVMGGASTAELVEAVHTRDNLRHFVTSQKPDLLTVLCVSTACAPCIKIYPAVLAIAKSFQGHAAFGRLMCDESDEAAAMMKELHILEVPTFIFFRGGREVGRHVGSSRGDLIGKILQQQAAAGIAPPPPPPGAGRKVGRRTAGATVRAKTNRASLWR